MRRDAEPPRVMSRRTRRHRASRRNEKGPHEAGRTHLLRREEETTGNEKARRISRPAGLFLGAPIHSA